MGQGRFKAGKRTGVDWVGCIGFRFGDLRRGMKLRRSEIGFGTGWMDDGMGITSIHSGDEQNENWIQTKSRSA